MGIFAMSIYYLQHKKKEIGIRKVNGATIPEITNLINRDFFSWITIAFLFAIPISWIIMDKWLQNFAYRINLSWWIFAVTIVIQLTIAFITICLQSQKAARENPINVLKSE
ncbi:ABC transporter permease [Xiashengella succiniciproducens]|uniref:ABC transporter permease n=1 Tax=Xiashengella succiniciproducens TaxID=2949635 RepID=UPI003AF31DE0